MKHLSYLIKVSLLVFFLQSCSTPEMFNKQMIENNSQICDLAEMNFEVKDAFFKNGYGEDYENFINSSNEFEVIHLYIESGTKISYISMINSNTLNLDSARLIIKKAETTHTDTLITNLISLSNEISKAEQGSFISVCFQNRSSPYYHIYLIRNKQTVYFKCHLNTSEFTQLKSEQYRKIGNAIVILNFLHKLEEKFSI